MKDFLIKFFVFLKNTTVRLALLSFVALIIAGYFIFPDFYRTQLNKIQSYYYVYVGDNAYKKNETYKAISNYEVALSLHPKHVKARYNLANLYVAYEDYMSALENYEKALELKPDYTIARIDYAIVLSEVAFNYDAAIREYELVIEKAPRWEKVPFVSSRGRILAYNKGVANYNKGLAWRAKSLLNAKEPEISRKYLLNSMNSYKDALKTLKEYDVYYNLAIVDQLLGRKKEAGRNYCIAIEKEPMKYEAHYNLAILLKSMKEYRYSIEEFKNAGLLLDVKGDIAKTRFVYDALNEVNQKLAIQDELEDFVEDIGDSKNKKGKKTYIGGKIVKSDEFDSAVIKNFKKCHDISLFEQDDILEGF